MPLAIGTSFVGTTYAVTRILPRSKSDEDRHSGEFDKGYTWFDDGLGGHGSRVHNNSKHFM